MNWFSKIRNDPDVSEILETFLDQFGMPGLTQSLLNYADTHSQYIYRTRSSVFKIKIENIFYLEIDGHDIRIHTQEGIYKKYGSLAQEARTLSRYGFQKCNQRVLVSVSKIREIKGAHIILKDGTKLILSRTYAPKLISSYITEA